MTEKWIFILVVRLEKISVSGEEFSAYYINSQAVMLCSFDRQLFLQYLEDTVLPCCRIFWHR